MPRISYLTYRNENPPTAVPRSIAHIFSYKPWIDKTRWRLNESLPLSLIHHSERKVIQYVQKLKCTKNTSSYYFRKTHEKVHEYQRLLLSSIYVLYLELDDHLRQSRSYRRVLPIEDQRELDGTFSENILFAAQALVSGFRVRGIESFTSELIQPAQQLIACYETLRSVLHNRKTLLPPYNDIFSILQDFDKAWVGFEERICRCYFVVTRPTSTEDEYLQVLMSETIIDAFQNNLFSKDDFADCEPTVVLAIPRLMLIHCILTDASHGWFSDPFLGLCSDIKALKEVDLLELKKLCIDAKDHKLNQLFLRVCATADKIHTQKASEYNRVLSLVFPLF